MHLLTMVCRPLGGTPYISKHLRSWAIWRALGWSDERVQSFWKLPWKHPMVTSKNHDRSNGIFFNFVGFQNFDKFSPTKNFSKIHWLLHSKKTISKKVLLLVGETKFAKKKQQKGRSCLSSHNVLESHPRNNKYNSVVLVSNQRKMRS
jgi:hypothetical protein